MSRVIRKAFPCSLKKKKTIFKERILKEFQHLIQTKFKTGFDFKKIKYSLVDNKAADSIIFMQMPC